MREEHGTVRIVYLHYLDDMQHRGYGRFRGTFRVLIGGRRSNDKHFLYFDFTRVKRGGET